LERRGRIAARVASMPQHRFRKKQPVADLPDAGDPEAARVAAIALLARRDHSCGELRAKLTRKGFAEDAVEAAIESMLQTGALDDERFAQNFTSYHADRGQGPVRIAAELRTLGLAAELIAQTLATGPDWGALARSARVRRFGAAAAQGWSEKARQARFLQYRGFSADHIRAALGSEFDPDGST